MKHTPRILLELFGPPFLGTVVLTVNAALWGLLEGGSWRAMAQELQDLPVALWWAYVFGLPLSAGYMLLMEAWFSRGHSARSGTTALLSSALGLLAGLGIIGGLHLLSGGIGFLEIVHFGFGGLIVGLLIGLILRRFTPDLPAMKIVIPGGNGHLGRLLVRALAPQGHTCVVLSRRAGSWDLPGSLLAWDGRTLGAWAAEIDAADVVINLAGRIVDCRYTARNLADMMASRVESTRVVGAAIAKAVRPPRVWLQASTATIYAHRYDGANDEATGVIGGCEPDAPAYWKGSIDIARAWEAELAAAPTRQTRKVALRAAMVLSTEPRTVLPVLVLHSRMGFGNFGDGRQYMSWIHEADFVEAVKFLIARDDLRGAVNLCAPDPRPNHDFLAILRRALGRRIGIPVPRWALEIGTFLLRTETELLLKSRRVVPTRLLEAGFVFRHPHWEEAARELVGRLLKKPQIADRRVGGAR